MESRADGLYAGGGLGGGILVSLLAHEHGVERIILTEC